MARVRRDSCPTGVSSPANVVMFEAHALPTLTVSELAALATLLQRVYPSPGASSSGGGVSALDGLLLMERVDSFGGSTSSRLVREDAYPFIRSRNEEAEDVVESLLRFVEDSERVSEDTVGLCRERDEGIGSTGWKPDRPWLMEVVDFCGRTWRDCESSSYRRARESSLFRPATRASSSYRRRVRESSRGR